MTDLDPSNTRFPGPTRVLNPNGISIGSAIFSGLTSVTDRQANHATRWVMLDSDYLVYRILLKSIVTVRTVAILNFINHQYYLYIGCTNFSSSLCRYTSVKVRRVTITFGASGRYYGRPYVAIIDD